MLWFLFVDFHTFLFLLHILLLLLLFFVIATKVASFIETKCNLKLQQNHLTKANAKMYVGVWCMMAHGDTWYVILHYIL